MKYINLFYMGLRLIEWPSVAYQTQFFWQRVIANKGIKTN